MKLATPGPRPLAAASVAAAITLVLPVFFTTEHHYPWEAIPGFFAIYGAVGCAAIIVLTKRLGKALLVKPEDWYGSGSSEDRS